MANEKYDIPHMIDDSVEKAVNHAIEILKQTFSQINKQLENITKNQEKMNDYIAQFSTITTTVQLEVNHLKNNKDDLYIKHKTTNERVDTVEKEVTKLKTGISTLRWTGATFAGLIFLVIAIIQFIQK